MRTVIVAVGNFQRGDDGVGVEVARRLKSLGLDEVEVIDAGVAPENYLGPIIKLQPRRVLIVDACQFNGIPGEFRLFDRTALAELSVAGFSTHTPPLSLFARLIQEATGAEVYLLGIQPDVHNTGPHLSLTLLSALPKILDFIQRWISLG